MCSKSANYKVTRTHTHTHKYTYAHMAGTKQRRDIQLVEPNRTPASTHLHSAVECRHNCNVGQSSKVAFLFLLQKNVGD